MTDMIVDSSAWISYLEGDRKGERFMEIIEDESNDLFTPSVSVAEVVSKFVRMGKDPNLGVQAIRALSNVLPIEEDTAIESGCIHPTMRAKAPKFSLSDAIVLALARRNRARVLTGDLDFRSAPEAIII